MGIWRGSRWAILWSVLGLDLDLDLDGTWTGRDGTWTMNLLYLGQCPKIYIYRMGYLDRTLDRYWTGLGRDLDLDLDGTLKFSLDIDFSQHCPNPLEFRGLADERSGEISPYQ